MFRLGKKKRKRHAVSKKFRPCSIRDATILFAIGAAWDAVLTADVIVTATYRILWAMATTAFITWISFTVYDKIISKYGVDMRRVAILAAGSATGAGVMTWLLKG